MQRVKERSRYWSVELDEDVEIVPRGLVEDPDDYVLYVAGTFMVSFKYLEEIEEYLGRLFVLGGNIV